MDSVKTMFGLLNIIKPAGPTSHDIVNRVRRLGGRGLKAGHTGTLDPFARGVLVVAIGQATRLATYIHSQPKRYRAEIFLGATSTTDDPHGQIRPTQGAHEVSQDDVRRILGRFTGKIRQTPPTHSAVHISGKRAYELARRNEHVGLAERTVDVYSIDLVRFRYPHLVIDVECGSGTYIRALGRDIGLAIGTGAYCRRLIRSAVGNFTLGRAVKIDRLDLQQHLISPLAALGPMPICQAGQADVQAVALGKEIPLAREHQGLAEGTEIALLSESKGLLAIAKVTADRRAHPFKVFVDPKPVL